MAESNSDLELAAAALNSGVVHLLRGMRVVDRLAGQTPARLSALSVLVFGGPRTLGALAEAEGVAGPTMTRIVDGMVRDGLAERRPHPRDGRAVDIAATSRGERLTRDAARRRIETIMTGLGHLTPADRDRLVSAAALIDRLAGVIRDLS